MTDLISKDKEYTTRDGREVRIYATDGDSYHPVHGAWRHGEVWLMETWRKDGRLGTTHGNALDLIEKPKRIVSWHNVYEDRLGGWFNSREEADDQQLKDRLCVYRIERDADGGNPEIFVEEV